jgi:hypothetical protein
MLRQRVQPLVPVVSAPLPVVCTPPTTLSFPLRPPLGQDPVIVIIRGVYGFTKTLFRFVSHVQVFSTSLPVTRIGRKELRRIKLSSRAVERKMHLQCKPPLVISPHLFRYV